ncbi:hypothetical protein [Neptuniibacter halophilus]|uniref:hypothetical protein n=1 Tax=Neptuniibacter halophilus TaxID=651666 RepID=UPI002572FDC6|nr:hypothetical protein [Neptuniibacter halophilus]
MAIKVLLLTSLLITPGLQAEEESEVPIEYQVTVPKGYFYGTVDGETAYENWRRGSFDKEPMVEVQPEDLPSNLPKPVVVPFVPAKVNEVPAGKSKKPVLKGEDKIFVQIGKDEQEARCFILGQGCEELAEPEVKDSIYFRPIEAQLERMEASGETPDAAKSRQVVKP